MEVMNSECNHNDARNGNVSILYAVMREFISKKRRPFIDKYPYTKFVYKNFKCTACKRVIPTTIIQKPQTVFAQLKEIKEENAGDRVILNKLLKKHGEKITTIDMSKRGSVPMEVLVKTRARLVARQVVIPVYCVCEKVRANKLECIAVIDIYWRNYMPISEAIFLGNIIKSVPCTRCGRYVDFYLCVETLDNKPSLRIHKMDDLISFRNSNPEWDILDFGEVKKRRYTIDIVKAMHSEIEFIKKYTPMWYAQTLAQIPNS
jgi:hypothetical protein